MRYAKTRSLFLNRQSPDLKVLKSERTKPARASEKATAEKAKKADAGKSSEMLALVLESLDEDKAEDVVSIDLTGKTPIADHMVVASGRSQRHVGAVADHLVRRLKEAGFGTSQVEGMKQGDWVLIDGGDVIIHVFRPEVREFYRLEKMWSADIPADQLAV
ncbi:ribosome silencing factor [Parvibaculum lavamentivorans]|uniref:ribosome silencing factor n=1 Tax=Parvibaculum lavamentivorans TaxID=256618 RepID=UPI0003027A30